MGALPKEPRLPVGGLGVPSQKAGLTGRPKMAEMSPADPTVGGAYSGGLRLSGASFGVG